MICSKSCSSIIGLLENMFENNRFEKLFDYNRFEKLFDYNLLENLFDYSFQKLFDYDLFENLFYYNGRVQYYLRRESLYVNYNLILGRNYYFHGADIIVIISIGPNI